MNALNIYRLKIMHTDEEGVEQSFRDSVLPLAPNITYPIPVSFFI